MSLPVGERVGGRFEVEGLLGEGGTARVYRVRHTTLGSVLAVKFLAPGSGGSPERLLQEGRIQARLRHPCVVPVTDVVEHAGMTGLVMEYVPGPSLADVLAQRRLDADEALGLFARVLAGVGAAHAFGVLHRDLKPHNVLLEPHTGGWLPKVADFGIARALDPSLGPRQTRVGFGVGTPGYMAPEQMWGSSEPDGRADVYALGVLLFELLTGELPSGSASGMVPANPDAVAARLGGTVGQAVARALQIQPDDRPADVRAFAAELYADRPELLAIATGAAPPTPVPLEGELRMREVVDPPTSGSTLVADDPADTPPPPPVVRPATGGGAPTVDVRQVAPPSSRGGLGAAVGGVLLVLAGLGGAWLLFGRGEEAADARSAATVEAGSAATVEAAATVEGSPTAPADGTAAPEAAVAPAASGAPEGAAAIPAGATPGTVAGASAAIGAAASPGTSAGSTAAAASAGAPAIPSAGTPEPAPAAGAAEAAPPATGTPSPPPTTTAAAPEAASPVAAAPSTEGSSAPEAPALPDVRGRYAGTAAGRPMELRVTGQTDAAVVAQLTILLGTTERTARYTGTVDAGGALTLAEDGGPGRLAVRVSGGALSGTFSTGGGKPLAVRATKD